MINHIAIFVKKIDMMLKFYEEVLGFKRKRAFAIEAKSMHELIAIDSSAEAYLLEAENIRLELIRLSKPQPVNAHKSIYGFHHIAIKVKSPELIIDKALEFGSTITQTFHKDHTIYFIKDPELNSIEVSQLR